MSNFIITYRIFTIDNLGFGTGEKKYTYVSAPNKNGAAKEVFKMKNENQEVVIDTIEKFSKGKQKTNTDEKTTS